MYAETTGELHPLDGPQQDSTPHPTGVPDFRIRRISRAHRSFTSRASTAIRGCRRTRPRRSATTSTRTSISTRRAGSPPVTSARRVSAPTTFELRLRPRARAAGDERAAEGVDRVAVLRHQLAARLLVRGGFTEAAGNAQKSNYGRGGVENDPILAEAQDNALGGSRNNANMCTPDDGMSPRMQVYLWTGKDDRSLTVGRRAHAGIGTAAFGPTELRRDGRGRARRSTASARPRWLRRRSRTPSPNKIVVVDRGNCTFRRKTLNVQNAGGVGIIIVNNVASTTPPPLGDDSALRHPITIPAVSVTPTRRRAAQATSPPGPSQRRSIARSAPSSTARSTRR